MKGLAERRDIRLGGTGVGYVGNPMGRPQSTDEHHPPSCAFHQSWGKVASQFHMGHDVNGNLVMQILQRHGHELPGLYSSGIRYNEADIQIPSGVFNLIDRVLFAEIHLNGPELHRELPLDAVPKLPEQINSPGSYHDIEAICRELPGQLFPDPEDAPVTRAHGPNLSLSNSCFIMILLQ